MEKVREFFYKRRFRILPIALVCGFFSVLSAIFRHKILDDLIFKSDAQNVTFGEFIKFRYNNWSGRVFSEVLNYVFCSTPFFFWWVVNTMVWVALCCVLSYLFNTKKSAEADWVLCGLLFACPFMTALLKAGQITSTINTLWPVTAFFATLVPFKWYLQGNAGGRPIRWYWALAFFPAALFACGVESIAVAMLLSSAAMIVYQLLSRRKTGTWKDSICPVVFFCVAVAWIIFHLTCPGNYARLHEEIKQMPYFNDLNFFLKAAQCAVYFINALVFHAFIFLAAFCALVAVRVFKASKSWEWRVAAILPLGVVVGLNLFASQVVSLLDVHSGMGRVFNGSWGGFSVENIYNFWFYMPALMVGVVVFGCLGACVYFILGANRFGVAAAFVFALGLLTPMIMMLTPTLFLGATRPLVLTYVCMAGVGVWTQSTIAEKREKS